jgi:hypothetical protein
MHRRFPKLSLSSIQLVLCSQHLQTHGNKTRTCMLCPQKTMPTFSEVGSFDGIFRLSPPRALNDASTLTGLALIRLLPLLRYRGSSPRLRLGVMSTPSKSTVYRSFVASGGRMVPSPCWRLSS